MARVTALAFEYHFGLPVLRAPIDLDISSHKDITGFEVHISHVRSDQTLESLKELMADTAPRKGQLERYLFVRAVGGAMVKCAERTEFNGHHNRWIRTRASNGRIEFCGYAGTLDAARFLLEGE